jgi:quercetin dioxygenase-like cupin family protein
VSLEEHELVATPLRTDLEAVAASAAGREGVVWALDASEDLNANLVHFGAGRGVGEHVNDEVDIVFVGVSGAGFVEVGGRAHALEPGKLVFVPKGAKRSTRGASANFTYLTVHGRRGPLRIEAKAEPKPTRKSSRMDNASTDWF